MQDANVTYLRENSLALIERHSQENSLSVKMLIELLDKSPLCNEGALNDQTMLVLKSRLWLRLLQNNDKRIRNKVLELLKATLKDTDKTGHLIFELNE